jgi:hypothetical protein
LKWDEGIFRWVLLLWLTTGLAVSVRTGLRPESHTVFPVFATASLHWWADEPVYEDYRPLDYFRYPPICAIALTPLALLGLTVGGILWSWLSLAIYGWGCWRFLREVIPERWSAGREALFLVLALFAALRGLWNAQSNALVTGLLLLGCAEVVRERWWRSAVSFALAILVKLTPLAVVCLVVVLRPRQLAGRLALLLVLGLLLPFATRPAERVIDQYAGWWQQMCETGSERWPGFRDAWTLWQVIRQPFTGESEIPLREPLTSPAYRVCQLATAGLAFLWVLGLARRGTPARQGTTLALAAGTGWLLLFGPSSEHPTFVLLAPTLLWGLLAERNSSWLVRLAGVCILVLGWGALTEPVRPWCPWLLASLPLGTLLYLLWLARLGERPDNAIEPGHTGLVIGASQR